MTNQEKIELFRQGVIERIESGMFNANKEYPCYSVGCGACGLNKNKLCDSARFLLSSTSLKDVFNNINLESYLKEHPEYMI